MRMWSFKLSLEDSFTPALRKLYHASVGSCAAAILSGLLLITFEYLWLCLLTLIIAVLLSALSHYLWVRVQYLTRRKKCKAQLSAVHNLSARILKSLNTNNVLLQNQAKKTFQSSAETKTTMPELTYLNFSNDLKHITTVYATAITELRNTMDWLPQLASLAHFECQLSNDSQLSEVSEIMRLMVVHINVIIEESLDDDKPEQHKAVLAANRILSKLGVILIRTNKQLQGIQSNIQVAHRTACQKTKHFCKPTTAQVVKGYIETWQARVSVMEREHEDSPEYYSQIQFLTKELLDLKAILARAKSKAENTPPVQQYLNAKLLRPVQEPVAYENRVKTSNTTLKSMAVLASGLELEAFGVKSSSIARATKTFKKSKSKFGKKLKLMAELESKLLK